jgi:hypothetical protein
MPLPTNSPHDHMILRVDLVGEHGRWKRPCLQTAHMTIAIESGPGGLTREVGVGGGRQVLHAEAAVLAGVAADAAAVRTPLEP